MTRYVVQADVPLYTAAGWLVSDTILQWDSFMRDFVVMVYWPGPGKAPPPVRRSELEVNEEEAI